MVAFQNNTESPIDTWWLSIDLTTIEWLVRTTVTTWHLSRAVVTCMPRHSLFHIPFESWLAYKCGVLERIDLFNESNAHANHTRTPVQRPVTISTIYTRDSKLRRRAYLRDTPGCYTLPRRRLGTYCRSLQPQTQNVLSWSRISARGTCFDR